MAKDEAHGEFAWLQGGPLLEVGFLVELMTSREEFLSKFVDKLEQTTPKVAIVSQPTDLNQSKEEFLNGYPWDPEDENTVYVHSWEALARVRFGEERESLIKVNQISDTLVHVNIYFWGGHDDGWGQKGVKNNDLLDFVLFLKSWAYFCKFLVGTIGFGAYAPFLFSSQECWPHPDFDRKHLTAEVMEANSNQFIFVLARKDSFGVSANTLEDNGYFIVKIDDALKQVYQA